MRSSAKKENRQLYQPDLAEFRELAAGETNLIPVYRKFPADLETPVSVYIKLMDSEGASFLLESVEGGEQVGRYSFIGIRPRGSIILRGRKIDVSSDAVGDEMPPGEDVDVLDILKAELGRYKQAALPGLPRFSGGAVGYLGYDVVRFFEELPATAEPGLSMPDAVFLLADTLVVFDHARHQLMILANAHLDKSNGEADVEMAYVEVVQEIERVSEKLIKPLPAIPARRFGYGKNGKKSHELVGNIPKNRFEKMVEEAKEHISAGDIFQVVLSQRLSRKSDVHPFAIYRALRMLNPSPYMFYFDFRDLDFQVIGSSPEMQVRLEDGQAHVRPIAGTRGRGENETEDEMLQKELMSDPKEQAEHVMLLDLGRNDLGRVSDYGSVIVREQMVVERYSHVMHLVSRVEGRLQEGKDAFDLMRATFPAGTVSGAPKVRAMEIIEALECERRGLYAGAVGYFSHDGSMDTCIAIRTMLVQGDTVYIQAGAGIVADSDPAAEYQECLNKAQALAEAVDMAEQGLV